MTSNSALVLAYPLCIKNPTASQARQTQTKRQNRQTGGSNRCQKQGVVNLLVVIEYIIRHQGQNHWPQPKTDDIDDKNIERLSLTEKADRFCFERLGLGRFFMLLKLNRQDAER